MTQKILNLEQGIKEIIRKLEKVTERPILTAIYGYPHSGKSYLIHGLANYFEKKELEVCRFAGAAFANVFEGMDWPERRKIIYLFHCAWMHYKDQRFLPEEDPTLLARRIAGKKIHLNIGIYNPHLVRKLDGDYDLLIENPESRIKPVPQ